MRALLDTHAFIWWANNDASLSVAARNVIEDRANEIFLSAATTWEMSIKVAKGRLFLSQPISSFVDTQMALYNFQALPVTHEQAYQVAALTTMQHKDPFDRLLVAQALTENLVLITIDPEMPQYGVTTLW